MFIVAGSWLDKQRQLARLNGMEKEILSALLDQKLSYREIATQLNMSYSGVRYWVKKHGLKSKCAYKVTSKWTDEDLRTAISGHTTLAQAIGALGLDPRGR
jgi:IS30 family transposase